MNHDCFHYYGNFKDIYFQLLINLPYVTEKNIYAVRLAYARKHFRKAQYASYIPSPHLFHMQLHYLFLMFYKISFRRS